MPFFHHSMLYILILYDLCLICAQGYGLLYLLDAFALIASYGLVHSLLIKVRKKKPPKTESIHRLLYLLEASAPITS